MIEAKLTATRPFLQRAYDRMPHAVQNFLSGARGWFLTKTRYTSAMDAYLGALRVHERWAPGEIADHQLHALRKILDHARATVPFYANYPKRTLKSLQEVAEFPLLTREVLSKNQDRLVSRLTPPAERIFGSTAGTSGTSLRVAYSEEVARRHWAFRMRQWEWVGVKTQTPRVTFYGGRVVHPERTKPPFWTYNFLERQTVASIFHLCEPNAQHYVQFLQQNSGKILEGFPSVLGILADFVLRSGRPAPMKAVFTEGEPLYPFLRENIEKAFGTRVFDLYGNKEYAGLIHECEKGQMHAIPDYGFLEILDQNDQPVPPGEEGYLVWTGFINETMPLIRYRIGDRGSWQVAGPCRCGRNFALVVPTITRDSDTLCCKDGRRFSPRALNQSLKRTPSLRFCQLIHERHGHVLIRGVGIRPDSYSGLMEMQRRLQRVLGPQFLVTATLADAPIVRTGGKIPLVIQNAA